MKTDSQVHKLNVIFLPFPAPGHMNPMVDTARLFAKHGVSATIITTHANALIYQKAIDSDFSSGFPIRTHVIQFPSSQVGLPDGVENMKDATTREMWDKIQLGVSMLRDQIELLFQDLQPDCLVTDLMYSWTVDSAAKLGIPRLYFCSSNYFSSCAIHSIRKYRPHERLVSDNQKFSIPGLPHNIEMITQQLEKWWRKAKIEFTDSLNEVYESESRSYGTLCNSFHELEKDYEQLHQSTLGIKCWSVGPVSGWVNNDGESDKQEHKEDLALAEEPQWLNWLNSKQNESVLYVSFGSLTRLSLAQLVEVAYGLESSGHNFIWVIRKKDEDEDRDNFLHDFEQRMKESEKGYIICNWAPQLLILNHPAIGGIVTHCGWNSVLESLSAGLSMITWPMFAEQFYNEKFITEVLKIGVPVGSKENKFFYNVGEDAAVKRQEIAKAVVQLMGSSQESKERRKRARKLGDAAKKTIEKGGSSYNNLMQLLDELKSLKKSRALEKAN